MSNKLSPMVTDAVTTTNVQVVGDASPMAIGSLYQTVGNSFAMATDNAVTAQQQANLTHQSVSTKGVTKLLSLPLT